MKNESPRQDVKGNKDENSSLLGEVGTDPVTLALAHEVRNPLTNINLAVDMLRSMTSIDNRELLLEIIKRASGQIEELILKLITPIKNQINHPDKQSIHLLLDEVLSATRDSIYFKHIRINKDYALHDSVITMNKTEMKMAITNLIVNAIEAIPGEGGILKILTRSSGKKFIIQIEDNGCGISRENLKEIFKPYFTNKPGGVGLGLAATREILRMNHGTLRVKSTSEKGTCFEIILEKDEQPLTETTE